MWGKKDFYFDNTNFVMRDLVFSKKKKGSDFYLEKCRLDFFIKNRPDFYKQNTDEIL